MSWMMEFFDKVIVGFILTLLIMISHSEGMCRNLAIKRKIPGEALVNHTVDRIQPIDNHFHCASMCYLEQPCFSYNFCEDHIDGSLCELLDSDHIRHGEHLVKKAGCTYYGSETSCSSNPCANNGTCQGDFSGEDKPYRCVCPQGFTGQNCEIGPKSCEELKLLLPNNTPEGFYDQELVGGGVSKVFCSYQSYSECGAGPWTLAMKIDGSKNNFKYDSNLWDRKSVFNPDGSVGGLDEEETVSPAYWTTPLTKLCLGMKYNNVLKWILINVNVSSLYDVMANQTNITTNLGKEKWRSLLPKTSLETNCNMEGFNRRCESRSYPNRKLRLGLFANNQNDCLSCESYVGLGPMVQESNDAPACGNHASKNEADNGYQNYAAFCYIMIQ